MVEVSGRALQDSRASETPRRHVPSPEPTYFVCGPRRKSRTGYIRVVFWRRCYSCRADEQGIRKTSMVQAKHNNPLVFPSSVLPLVESRCVWVCGLVWPWVFDNCKATVFCFFGVSWFPSRSSCYKPVHSWWTVMSELVPSS